MGDNPDNCMDKQKIMGDNPDNYMNKKKIMGDNLDICMHKQKPCDPIQIIVSINKDLSNTNNCMHEQK